MDYFDPIKPKPRPYRSPTCLDCGKKGVINDYVPRCEPCYKTWAKQVYAAHRALHGR